MKESDIISKYLRKIMSKYSEAENLQNDTAHINITKSGKMIITQDTMIEQVHFLRNSSPESIVYRVLAMNLSDISSSGTKPAHYLMSLSLNQSINEEWVSRFCQQLESLNLEYKIRLIGGDIVFHKGDIAVTITMMSEVGDHKLIDHKGAKIGDVICCAGYIGDSACGLKILQNHALASGVNEEIKADLVGTYEFPLIDMTTGQEIAKYASAMTDISDGLVKDLKKIALASQKGFILHHAQLPLSLSVQEFIKHHEEYKLLPLYGGDDYQILFTTSLINAKILASKFNISIIGSIIEEEVYHVLDQNNQEIRLGCDGFEHGIM